MKIDLAPIVLFTFNRLEHTKKTIEALQKNILAKDSNIYIYSDGARNDTERKKIDEVRSYLESIDGFKCINIIKAESNKGLANSVIEGITEIINKYGRVIVIEDDLITSKYFIQYMNDALCYYKNREEIWSISGYTPNIKFPKEYKDEVYLAKRGCSWGWATWQNRWDGIDWEISDYSKFKKDREKKKSFNQSGNDMCIMLKDQMLKRIDSWAIRWCYNQFLQGKYTVYPVKSYIKNIGTDLSGTHSAKTEKYESKLYGEEIKLNPEIEYNNEINIEFREFYNIGVKRYLISIIKDIGLYKIGRSMRNKILKVK